MKSFLTFRIINTRIFLHFQKVVTLKLWQNTQFTTASLFCAVIIEQFFLEPELALSQ